MSETARVRISAAPSVARSVLRRVVAAVGAHADLSIDRIDDAQTIVDAVVSHLDDARTDATVAVGPDGLELSVGPFPPGRAATVIERTAVPELGPLLERLADRVWTEPDGEHREYLVLLVGRSAA